VINKLKRTVIAVFATNLENVAFLADLKFFNFFPTFMYMKAYLTMDSRDPSSLERKALKVPCRPARLA
jgi:hypothetical protein